MIVKNIFATPERRAEAEVFETLLETNKFKLERIVSTGQSTLPGEWYDQDHEEWVLLLSGKACLLFEGETEKLVLQPGDFLLIPSHKRHRVEWTAPGMSTVWLALHCDS